MNPWVIGIGSALAAKMLLSTPSDAANSNNNMLAMMLASLLRPQSGQQPKQQQGQQQKPSSGSGMSGGSGSGGSSGGGRAPSTGFPDPGGSFADYYSQLFNPDGSVNIRTPDFAEYYTHTGAYAGDVNPADLVAPGISDLGISTPADGGINWDAIFGGLGMGDVVMGAPDTGNLGFGGDLSSLWGSGADLAAPDTSNLGFGGDLSSLWGMTDYAYDGGASGGGGGGAWGSDEWSGIYETAMQDDVFYW